MKSEEKDASVSSRPVVRDGKLERQEREAAALRANLRRRKQQQIARREQSPANSGPDGPGPEETDDK